MAVVIYHWFVSATRTELRDLSCYAGMHSIAVAGGDVRSDVCTMSSASVATRLYRFCGFGHMLGLVTGQNVDKPKHRQPKHRQTETSTNQNMDKPKRRQTKKSTGRNVDKPKRQQTKKSTNQTLTYQNFDRPKRRQTGMSTFHISTFYSRTFVFIFWGHFLNVPTHNI